MLSTEWQYATEQIEGKKERAMDISSISTSNSVERTAEQSILVARKALQAQKMEGMTAVSLINQSVGTGDDESGTLMNVYA